MKIKICGIRNIQEIDYVNSLKPDYIGFVFAKSKRYIAKEEAEVLLMKLNKDIKSVGVFRNNSLEEIISILKTVPLYAVQLHGSENEQFIHKLREYIDEAEEQGIIPSEKIEIWKAVSANDDEAMNKYFSSSSRSSSEESLIDKFLIDGSNPGSGQTYSLDNIKNKVDKSEFFLAGGIDEDNVVERINAVHPMGVDVSSGVEIVTDDNKFMKSYEKMKNLIDKVRNYEV